jgi:hypothetical protein
LVGSSRTGKTAWARSLGTHAYFNTYFNLAVLNAETAKYAIFDDLADWRGFSSYKAWLGCQWEFAVTDKYKHKQQLIWGRPCIVLANLMPLFDEFDWIRQNCFIVDIGNTRLY